MFLSRTVYEITSVIEDNGYEAVPLFNYPLDIKEMGIGLRDGQPAPNVHCDPKRAAVAAGLGFISRLGEFISPEYGPLMRLSIILTDADIKPDAPLDINYCDGCSDCVDACPLQAIDKDSASERSLNRIRWSQHDFRQSVCKNCQNGAQPSRFVGSREIDRIPAACGRACVASLERRGLLKKTFHNPFRVRRAWSVSLIGDVNSGDR
jgi:ferredoxin